jgi:hypothetical protein
MPPRNFQVVYEVRPRKDHRGVDLISDAPEEAGSMDQQSHRQPKGIQSYPAEVRRKL